MDIFSILTMIGGLALFLYGMEVLGGGLKKASGGKLEMILEKLLGNLGLEINEKTETRFYCNCDKVRVGKVLISIGEKELQDMIDEGKEVELNCHFCNTNYTFSVEELKELLELAR